MLIGEFLKKYRINKNLSVRELAENIGVDKYRLQKWEYGSNPKLEDGEKIKSYFGLDDLFNISEEVLKKCLKGNSIGNLLSKIDSIDIIQLKDQLLEEKDKRINALERTIDLLEFKLGVMNNKKSGIKSIG